MNNTLYVLLLWDDDINNIIKNQELSSFQIREILFNKRMNYLKSNSNK